MNRRFRITKDFFAPETASQYVAGMTYTARTEKLVQLVHKWVDERKAVWLPTESPGTGPASVAGTGTVGGEGSE